MWAGGVSAEDRLDAEASRHVVRRVGAMLRPQRRAIATAMAVIVWSTLATLAGPVLVRYGIDEGIRAERPGALGRAVEPGSLCLHMQGHW